MRIMSEVVRTGISLPRRVLEELDHLIKELGINSRSKAISEAISLYIGERMWLVKEEDTWVVGSLTMVYRHDEASDRVSHVQHHFTDIIRSTSHIHLSEDMCLEVVIITGPMSKARELVKEIQRMRGIEVIKPFMIPLRDHG